MRTERCVSLLLELALLVFLLLLLLNHAEEFISLSLSLLGHHNLLLDELLPPGNVQVLGLFTCQLGLLLLFSARPALSLLEGPLGPECIDFALTVGSALL